MPSMPREVRFLPVTVAEVIQPDDVESQDSGQFIAQLLTTTGVELHDHDVLALSSKVASLLDDGLVWLEDVIPSRKARLLGWAFGRDPRRIQLVLEQGKVLVVVPLRRAIRLPAVRRMLEQRSGNPTAMVDGYSGTNAYTFIVRSHAAYLDEAGIDLCNSPEGYATLLPEDPCRLARQIRHGIQEHLGVDVAVILTDTVTPVGRMGSQDVAIGYSGIDPVTRDTFSGDLFGTPRSGGIDLTIDSIAGMAGHLMGQTTERTPMVIVRGLEYTPERDDELPGMQAVALPVGCEGALLRMTLLATLWFRWVSALSFQPKTRVMRRTRP
jgi:coenzyme F420-0:L-glutamate ligase / coenzyme F420-1:gamma-L-glutamate ligase